MTDLLVTHDRVAGRFEAMVDGQRCVLNYQLVGAVAHIVHTAVPAALQGRGLAAALVQQVLVQLRALGWRVRPLCSYVRAYMQRHPETQDLLDTPF